jgi:hypothetical protein
MRLEEQLRETIRMQGKSEKTFEAYWHWVRQFLLFAREKRLSVCNRCGNG